MRMVPGSERILAGRDASPVAGRVVWSAAKSLWIGPMTAAAILLGPVFASWDAVLLFLVTSGVTLCFGHSVGMHRRLIHGSFAYANVHAPHVSGYFVTTNTSFELRPLPNGRTELIERTAHELKLDPVLYWMPLARWIVDLNNGRVLAHIRHQAEL